ncbi:Mn2+/Fe2+ transporter, NRAMP family [Helicobacter bizzozeronii CCUG 35545]|nr:Mn2+/Fe2+ transporter, NRAMP family [Helicobacter bizzozeronii CCUG 35545]
MTFIITLGALAFNIGNVGGAALGLQALVGLDLKSGGLLSALLAILIFLSKSAGHLMDRVAQILGVLMIILIAFVAFFTHPPIAQVAKETFLPSHFSMAATITLIGGSVGGYIVFAGAHRLIDLGIVGEKNQTQMDRATCLSIGVAALVRVLLFLAVLGVVQSGHVLSPANPAGSAFGVALGSLGYKIFGLVFLAASLTSIVGASYTSVSFFKKLGLGAKTPKGLRPCFDQPLDLDFYGGWQACSVIDFSRGFEWTGFAHHASCGVGGSLQTLHCGHLQAFYFLGAVGLGGGGLERVFGCPLV